MKILKILLLILLYNISNGQDTTMYLHSWKKLNKIDKISNNVYLTIDFTRYDSSAIESHCSYGGVMLYVLNDKIVMSIDNEEIEKHLTDGTIIKSSNYYSLKDSVAKNSKLIVMSEKSDKRKFIHQLKTTGSHHSFLDSIRLLKSETLRAIDIASIQTISYTESKKIADVGVFMTVMSGFAAFVVAPLVSINYKTGNFNQKTYYSVLAGCGLGFAVGIPLATVFSKRRNYRINTYTPDSFDNNYYHVLTN